MKIGSLVRVRLDKLNKHLKKCGLDQYTPQMLNMNDINLGVITANSDTLGGHANHIVFQHKDGYVGRTTLHDNWLKEVKVSKKK